MLLLENKTVSHLQLIQAAKDFQCEKQPQGKYQIKDLAIRPFAKTSETLKVVPGRYSQVVKRASMNIKDIVPKRPNPKIAIKKSKGWACHKKNCGCHFT